MSRTLPVHLCMQCERTPDFSPPCIDSEIGLANSNIIPILYNFSHLLSAWSSWDAWRSEFVTKGGANETPRPYKPSRPRRVEPDTGFLKVDVVSILFHSALVQKIAFSYVVQELTDDGETTKRISLSWRGVSRIGCVLTGMSLDSHERQTWLKAGKLRQRMCN